MNKLNNRIFIVGFMGCGKTTVGNELQQRLANYTFVDTDLLIEQMNGVTITQLFASKGEAFFRNEEAKLVAMLIANASPTIVATGGGLPLHNNTMHTLCANGTVIYLKLSPESLTKRLVAQKHTRPLIADVSDELILNYITTLLHERAPTYAKAHYTVNGEMPVNEIVTELIQLLKS